MANIVVTIYNAHVIKVDFGDYYPDNYETQIAYYNRVDIEKIELKADYVKVHVLDQKKDWDLSYNGTTGAFTVDSVAGTNITSNAQLAEEIAKLIVS